MKNKFLWVLVFFAFAAIGSHASPSQDDGSHVKPIQRPSEFSECIEKANFSAALMEARQIGVRMDELLSQLIDKPSKHPEVISVYSTTRYMTERHQVNAVERYRETVLLECVTNQ